MQRKIQKGRYGAKHILAVKILEGNDKLLAKLLDKFFPDQISHTDPVAGYFVSRDELERQRLQLKQLIEDTKAQAGGLFESEPEPISKAEEEQIIKAFRNFGMIKEDDKATESETVS